MRPLDDHEPVLKMVPRCASCGLGLVMNAATGWQHELTLDDRQAAYVKRQRELRAERGAAAPAYTGPETACHATSYRQLGRFGEHVDCQMKASKVRDGHPVCGNHARAGHVIWQRDKRAGTSGAQDGPRKESE